MKPRELYSGNAPQAMAMMGQGLPEVGANIARSIQSGYSALGQSIGQGLQSVGEAYGDYKQAKTSNDITRLVINDTEHGKMLGLNPDAPDYEERKKSMLGMLDKTIKEHGQFGGAQFSKQVLSPIYENYRLGQEYAQKIKVATALSDPEVLLKGAQTQEAAARSAQLNRKANPSPALDFSKGVDLNAPATPSAPAEAVRPPAARQLSGGAITPYGDNLPTPVTAAVQEAAKGASPLFPESEIVPRRFDYENLRPEHQAYVDASTFGKEHWNVLGEEQQIKNLMNIDKPNFGLTRSRR